MQRSARYNEPMTAFRILVCTVGLHGLTACSTGSSPAVDTAGTTATTSPSTSSTLPTTTNGPQPTSDDVTGDTGGDTGASESQTPTSPSQPTSAPPGETEESGAAPTDAEPTSSAETTSPVTTEGDVTTDSSASLPQTWVFTASSGGPLRAFQWDAVAGALSPKAEQPVGSGPNEDVFVAMVPGSTQAFVVTNKAIVVYDFDPATGSFTEGAHGTTVGTGTYVSVSADMQHVYVAHYNDNALSYLTYKDGAFSTAQRFDSGQKVHSAQESKAGGWVLVPCLGSDHVAQYRRDGDTLVAAAAPTVAVAGGPRHFAFHPNKPVAYVLTELTAELRAFEFSETNGLGAVLGTEVIGTQSGGKYWGSDVKVSPDGNDVFAVERNSKKVYHFDVGQDGALQPSGVEIDLGGVVRAFDISSNGSKLFMGNDKGELRVLSFDAQSNELTELPGAPTGVGVVYTTIARDF
jgi:6-phosphogluconolactonase